MSGPAHLAFPAWMALSQARLSRVNPWLTTVRAEEVRCLPLHPEREVRGQVDGEAVGVLPLTLKLVPDALTLLMP